MSKLVCPPLALLMIFVCACAKNADSPAPAPSSSIPAKLSSTTYEKIKQPVPLSPETKAQIALYMRKSQAKLPSEVLVFDEASTDKKDKMKALARLDSVGRANLEKVKTLCDVDPGSDETKGTAEVGSIVTTNHTKSVSGSECPFSLSAASSSSILYSSVDAHTGTVSGKLNMRELYELRILDQSTERHTGISGYSFVVEMSGSVENYSADSKSKKLKSGAEYVSGTVRGEWNMGGKKIPLTGSEEAIVRPNQTEMQALFNFELPTGNFVLGIVSKNGSTEIYVNGQRYTKQQLNDEFGISELGM